MVHMKNIHRYEPVDPFLGDVYYFKDDRDLDWYLMEPYWSPDTFKVVYGPDRAVHAVLDETTGINPEGMSVVELEEVPPNCVHPYAGWVYIDGIVAKLNSQYEIEARDYRNAFLRATDVLYVPDYTIADELLTPDQRAELQQTRHTLKTWPKTPEWPLTRPVIPDWLQQEAIKQGFQEEVWL